VEFGDATEAARQAQAAADAAQAKAKAAAKSVMEASEGLVRERIARASSSRQFLDPLKEQEAPSPMPWHLRLVAKLPQMGLVPDGDHTQLPSGIHWFGESCRLDTSSGQPFYPACSLQTGGDQVTFLGYGPNAANVMAVAAASGKSQYRIDNSDPMRRWWPAITGMTAGGLLQGGFLAPTNHGGYPGLISRPPSPEGSKALAGTSSRQA